MNAQSYGDKIMKSFYGMKSNLDMSVERDRNKLFDLIYELFSRNVEVSQARRIVKDRFNFSSKFTIISRGE